MTSEAACRMTERELERSCMCSGDDLSTHAPTASKEPTHSEEPPPPTHHPPCLRAQVEEALANGAVRPLPQQDVFLGQRGGLQGSEAGVGKGGLPYLCV